MPINRDYHVRDLVKMTPEECRRLPDGGIWLTFDDGTKTKSKTRKAAFAAPYWRFMAKHGGKITQEVSMCRTVDGEYEEDMYDSDTQYVLGEAAFWNTFYNGKQTPERFWMMSEDIYVANNVVYNDSVTHDMKFMSMLSYRHVQQVDRHPKIVDSRKKYFAGERTLEEHHDFCYKIVKTDTKYFGTNDIHIAARCGLLSITQVKQLIGPRGNVSDINSEAFPHVIDQGFYQRLNYAYDSTIEARSSSIALYMQGGPLEDSEYNNRLNGLSCGYLRKVHYGDCGTKRTILWMVKDAKHLRAIKGKMRLMDDGSLQRITGKEKGLIGQSVRLRSASVCEHHERGVICSTCIGQNAYVVPPGGSPGHVLIIDPLGQISQTILSTKHVLSNVIALTLEIQGEGRDYMRNHPENKFLVTLRPDRDFKDVRMRIPHHQVQFLSDLEQVDDLSKVNITAISDVENVIMTHYKDDVPNHYASISTVVAGTGSCLTKDFLAYIMDEGYDIVDEYVEFDLSNWDKERPILVTKRVSQDVTETLNQFRDFIQPKKDRTNAKCTPITHCDSPDEAIMELFRVLSSRITVNVSQLEMFVTALMSRVDDYNLPNGDEPFRFITLKECLSKRSSLVAIGYQGQSAYLTSPGTYIRDAKSVPTHPMDALLVTGNPEEVLH